VAHSPLRMFTEFHNKHVLVTGQGPIEFIARSLGFKKVTTMDQLRHAFPALDAVDHKRRRAAACAFEKYFPRIEAVVLFGEPVRWETSLQLLIDVLLSDGRPSSAPEVISHPHLPVLACNMDLQWMAEAVMPRFGHGAFLLCLENLYKKVTSRELVYTALIGKPSEITYRHSEHVLQEQAVKLGLKDPVRNIYCIGDNICTDIFGANLYNKYLQRERGTEIISQAQAQSVGLNSRSIDNLLKVEGELKGATSCYSILVETGVFSRVGGSPVSLDHSPRDFLPVENSYQEPTFATENVLGAVDLIFEREQYKIIS
jgi:HAD superfamily hydrolase (TIGR01456 family)